jgi:hypothetical protein
MPNTRFRSHDYGHLVRRWRAAARARGLKFSPYASASGYELFVAETRRPDAARPWLYLSAGIHGDESAATEAALEWVAASPLVESWNLLAFPCLNPWGLVNNLRTDAEGRDLNRTYHDDAVPQTAAHKALLAGRRFDLALALHEDYDANGVYIYEIKGARPYIGEELLAAAARHLPADTRRTIEGRRSTGAGLVRRAITPDLMPLHPEAFRLFFHHTGRTLTLETPSEAHIDARVAAHVAMVERAAELCLTPG